MAEQPPLRNYSTSRAILMGTWNYTYLPPIPAAGYSFERVAGLLTGPLCGWPTDRVLSLTNEPGPGDLHDRLITAFEDVTDIALFYYVGHGQIDADNELCLGLVGSRSEANRRAATSLVFQAIRRALLDSPARTKIVILDCCFAGLANEPVNTLAALPADVLDMTAGSGAYTMAASGPYMKAWYETGSGAVRPQTFFTKYLVDLIESGIPGQASKLRLHPLFTQLRENLSQDGRPVPRERSVDAARDFIFAYNAAPPEMQRDPDMELRELSQRLAEAEAARAREQTEGRAREEALHAEVAQRTMELERLQERARNSSSLPTGQREELKNAIEVAERNLEESATAHANAAQEDRNYAEEPSDDSTVGISESRTSSPLPTSDAGVVSPELQNSASFSSAELKSGHSQLKPLSANQDDNKRPNVKVTRRNVFISLAGTVVAAGLALAGWELNQDNTPKGNPSANTSGHSPSALKKGTHPTPVSGIQNMPPGRTIWNFHTPGPVNSGPTVVGNIAYVANDNPNGASDSHNVYALNSATGSIVWKHENGAGIYTDLSVADGLLFVGSDFHDIFALRTSNGSLAWKFTTGDTVIEPPAVVDGVVYAGSTDHNIYALKAATGEKLWSHNVGDFAGGPAISGGLVFVGSINHHIYALKSTDGTEVWDVSRSGGIPTTPEVDGDSLYFGSNDHNLYAVYKLTGQARWTYTTNGQVQSGIVSTDGVVYFGSNDGSLYAVQATTGRKIWSYSTGGPIRSGISISDGVVYFGSQDNNVYAVYIKTGHTRWAVSTGGPINSQISISNGTVLVGSGDGNVYAIKI